MVFAARTEQALIDTDDVSTAESSTATSSSQGRPSAREEEETSDSSREGGPSASSGEGEPTAVKTPKAKAKGTQRQKQRIVKSKYLVAASARHNLFTHFPLDMNCEICKLVKLTRAACRAGTVPEQDGLPPAQKFGDRLTADHKVLTDDQTARSGAKYALVIQDEYTKWIQAYATASKGHEGVVMAFRRFMPLNTQPSHVYVDSAQELLKALRELKWNHDTPTPHRPETNGVIERAVRRVKEGTSATLLQSGLTEVWWQEAMDCSCVSPMCS